MTQKELYWWSLEYDDSKDKIPKKGYSNTKLHLMVRFYFWNILLPLLPDPLRPER